MSARFGEDALALAFEVQRPRLLRVAYMTLGSMTEAEDCVQEARFRLRGIADPTDIRSLGAWLTAPAAVRQLASRARRDVATTGPRFPPTAAEQRVPRLEPERG